MLAFFSVTPIDKNGESLSPYVSRSLKLIKESGLEYQLTAMGTIIEGESTAVFDLIRRCHEAMTEVSDRVSTSVKIDDRKGATGRIEGKVSSVENCLK